MKTDFSNLPVGTKVWSVIDGHGEIKEISYWRTNFPISCKFYAEGKGCSHYTPDGKKLLTDVYPTLFLEPLPGFEDGRAFESELPDERVGRKCIFISDNCLFIDVLVCIDKDDNSRPYKSANTGGFKNCVLYTTERLIELSEKLCFIYH